MAELSVQEQILIELKKQNALLEEQLRPQREADARKKKQDEIRQSPEYLSLDKKRKHYIAASNKLDMWGRLESNKTIRLLESQMRKMLNEV